MARYGAKSPLWAPIAEELDRAHPTYGTGLTIGKLASCGVTPNYSEGSLPADNTIAEYAKEIKDQDIALETDDLIARNAVAIYGAKFNGNDIEYSIEDNSPYGGYAFYHTAQRSGQKVHIGHFYPKVRASRGPRTFETKGDAVTFGTESISMKSLSDNLGLTEVESEPFITEDDAYAWCANKLGVGVYFKINVQQQGETSAKYVDHDGVAFVPSGTNFEIVVTGHASVTAAYDNGTDTTATITGGGGTYKLTGVTIDHDIVIVF
ncbi:MAG: hypothetical protein RSG53_08870 [Oscillospiraceae bacterium]